MQKAQIYIAKTPAGNYKAYAVGYANNYNGDPNNTEYYYKPLPDQPLRGFGNPLEVSGYINNRFAAEHMFDEWSTKQAGDGSELNKSIDNWQTFNWSNNSVPQQQNINPPSNPEIKGTKMPRRKKIEMQEEEIEQDNDYEEDDDDDNGNEVEEEPEPKPQKRRKQRTRKQNRKTQNNAFENQIQQQQQQPFIQNISGIPTTQPNFFSNFPQQNRLSYDQYKQIADGVLQVFENTLVVAASYNMAINSVTLAHAYRAIKLIGAMQFYPAFEAIRIASTHDNMWTSLRDAIIQANRTIGINI